jgi:hypothetical protein
MLVFSNVDGGEYGPFIDNVSISVVASMVAQLSRPTANPGGFSFDLIANADSQFAIQSSTNLVHWDTVRVVTIPPDGKMNVLEGITPGTQQKFYRAMRQ